MDFFTSWTIGSFIFNIICSLFASLLFIYILLEFFRPNIIIVPFIAKNDSPFDETDKICYGFKIINKTFFTVYDINAEAHYFTIFQGENNVINKVYDNISLKKSKVSSIKRRRLFNTAYGDNCLQFFTYDDLEIGMNGNKKYIQFQVTCRHGLTGLSKVHSKEFVKSSDIREGSFISGNYQGVTK